jgi:hypothetical protein
MITDDNTLISSLKAPQPSHRSSQDYSGSSLNQIMKKFAHYADWSITLLFDVLSQVEENLDRNATS